MPQHTESNHQTEIVPWIKYEKFAFHWSETSSSMFRLAITGLKRVSMLIPSLPRCIPQREVPSGLDDKQAWNMTCLIQACIVLGVSDGGLIPAHRQGCTCIKHDGHRASLQFAEIISTLSVSTRAAGSPNRTSYFCATRRGYFEIWHTKRTSSSGYTGNIL